MKRTERLAAEEQAPHYDAVPSTEAVPTMAHQPRIVGQAAPDVSGTDRVFAEQGSGNNDFVFDGRTARVFDDMVSRSVPLYHEIQRMVAEMAADFAEAGTSLYDLGCSTATTLLALDPVVEPSVRFVGIDNSAEMLGKARSKLEASGMKRPYELIESDLNRLVEIEGASVVTMILTLMFVRPLRRQHFIDAVYRGLRPGGCLILVEKLTMEDSTLNRLFINYYYAMKKRHNYSEMEVAQKRESLENVLIPYRYEENAELLTTAGFRSVEQFFRWYNFGGIIAVK
jgi:tRNA (cmo5U34)-methyltransferase